MGLKELPVVPFSGAQELLLDAIGPLLPRWRAQPSLLTEQLQVLAAWNSSNPCGVYVEMGT